MSRIVFLLTLGFVALFAEPSLAQVKQAVAQNPALLNTPQAKAAMAEKGVTISEVNQKLSEGSATTVETSKETDLQNEIDTSVETQDEKIETQDEKIETEEKQELIKKPNALAKRINPFYYKTNKEIREELMNKQQVVSFSKLKRYSSSFYANKNKLDSSSLPTPDDYILTVGDKIGIHIYGDRDKSYSLAIKNDGTIDLSFIGPLKVGGMEFSAAKKHLAHKLKSHFKMSDFNINIEKYSTIQATLIGDVKYPGIYNLSSFSTVKDLLIVAKGVRDSASVRKIKIKRDSKIIATLDFYDLLFKGDSFGTLLLKHGDVVIIEKAKTLVQIDGYVNNAAIFELKEKENLKTLIEYAGGMKPNASKLEIKISRFDNNAKLKTFKVSYKKSEKFKMQNGDKVYIYPLDFTANSSINIYGNIIRPGAYNFNSKKASLNSFLKGVLKGGMKKFFLPNTYFEYALIKRYSDALEYESKSFNLKDAINGKVKVKLKPNDKIYIFSMNDIYSNAYVLTKGATLVKPGKLQYVAGITIQDAINASGIDGVLDDKVRVTTYTTPDLMPKTSFYSLEKDGNTVLNAYDELEVFDYYATHILEPVSIKGEVVKAVSVFYEKGMSVQDLLNVAGGFNKKAYTKSLSIIRYWIDDTQTRQQKVLNYDLDKIKLSEIMLEPYDEVKISKILGWDSQDYETVQIKGEVRNPMNVKYGTGMTVKDLIIMSGGLTKRAYSRNIEIVRYSVDENETRQREILKVAVENKAYSNIKLQPYDIVRIFKIPKWNESKSVLLKGEVRFPGTYSIENGERLASVIKRAGGYTSEAFIEGAVFTRESIRKQQIEQYNRSLAKIKRELALYNAMPANSKKAAVSSGASSTLNEVILEARKYQPIGRVSINLERDLEAFEKSQFNIALKDQDSITIPNQIDTVTVFGEVFNPSSFVYNNKLDADEYLDMASGLSRAADSDNVYVIHANGMSEPLSGGWFSASVEIEKGDTIVVPIYIKEYNTLEIWDSVSKIFSSFALTAAAVNSLGVI